MKIRKTNLENHLNPFQCMITSHCGFCVWHYCCDGASLSWVNWRRRLTIGARQTPKWWMSIEPGQYRPHTERHTDPKSPQRAWHFFAFLKFICFVFCMWHYSSFWYRHGLIRFIQFLVGSISLSAKALPSSTAESYFLTFFAQLSKLSKNFSHKA